MVSSVRHVLRGQSDTYTVAVTVGFTLWWLSLYSRRPIFFIWVLIGIFPLILLPDFTLPLDLTAYLPVSSGPLVDLVNVLTSGPGVAALAAVALGYALFSRPKRIEPPYISDPQVSRSFTVVGKKSAPALEDIPALVKEMRASFHAGVSRPLAKRVEQLKALRRLFTENEDAMFQALKDDLGRPTLEAFAYDISGPIAEIDEAIKHLDQWTAPEPVGFNVISFPSTQYRQAEPLGVALIISTWNYPFLLALSPLIGSIAAGNVSIVKPCVVSKATARLMGELIPKYLDPNVVAVVGATFDRDRVCTSKLLEQHFDVIFFTGGSTPGKDIMAGAARNLTPCILELGGKNPVFVDKHADISLAAKRSVWGRMMNAGQQCIAPDYVLCDKDVIDDFCKEAARWVKEMYGEDPQHNGNIGRIVGDSQMKRLTGLLDHHKADVVMGGNYDVKDRYIAPTVVRVDSLECEIMKEETFGPILIVVPVDHVDKAIEFVNSRPKPLALYLFSKQKWYQDRVVHNTSSGGVTINGTIFHVAHPGLPFGGVGYSGMGSYHGKAGFDVFSHKKPVLTKATWKDFGLLTDPFFVYPPWTPGKLSIIRLVSKWV